MPAPIFKATLARDNLQNNDHTERDAMPSRQDESTKQPPEMMGSVRVVNVRGESEYRIQSDETLVMVDRSNPTLGNPHRMLSKSRLERERVVSAYARDLEADIQADGPKYQAIKALAERVADGEKIGLGCWCVPFGLCHAETIAQKVDVLAQEIKAKQASGDEPDSVSTSRRPLFP